HRLFLDGQRGERGILQLAEAPFVWVGNEVKRPGSDDLPAASWLGKREIGFLVRNQQSGVDRLAAQSGLDELLVVFPVALVDLTEQYSVASKDKSARITIRCADAIRRRHGRAPLS